MLRNLQTGILFECTSMVGIGTSWYRDALNRMQNFRFPLFWSIDV